MGIRQILTRYETWLKATRLSNDAARYNPLHYGFVRRSIEAYEGLGFEERQARSQWQSRQVLQQARQTVYGRERALDWAAWPILDKRDIRDRRHHRHATSPHPFAARDCRRTSLHRFTVGARP